VRGQSVVRESKLEREEKSTYEDDCEGDEVGEDAESDAVGEGDGTNGRVNCRREK
jgi:hypothetical protein